MATELEEFQLPSIIFGRETKGRLPLVVDGVSFKYGNGVTVQTFWFFLRHVIRREGLSWLVESITHSPAAVTFDRSLISAFLSARHQFRISRSKVKTNILTFFNLMFFFQMKLQWLCLVLLLACLATAEASKVRLSTNFWKISFFKEKFDQNVNFYESNRLLSTCSTSLLLTSFRLDEAFGRKFIKTEFPPLRAILR